MSLAKEQFHRQCSIIGAHLLMVPMSFMWYYGNLAAYTDSYIRFSCQPEWSEHTSQWLPSSYVVGMFPGAFMVKPLQSRVGLKGTGTIAMVMVNVALLGSAWSLRLSVAWTAVMYGVLLGQGTAISASVSVQIISGWAREKSALLMATSTGTATMLSVPINQIITAYINPENLKPNTKIGPNVYFSQSEILDRVPGAVIILGLITLCLQAAGCILIRNPPNNATDSNKETILSDVVSLNRETNRNVEDNPFCLEVANVETNNTMKNMKGYGGTELGVICREEQTEPMSNNHCRNTNIETHDRKDIGSEELRSYTPSEVLMSPVFYAVFLFGMALEYGLLLKSNFYKKFALLYIRDDKYLTLVGTLIPIISTCSRIIFGVLMDRAVLNFKDVIMFGLSLNCVICAFWYTAARVNESLYMFIVLGLAVAQSLYYVVVPTSALRLFGPGHTSTNYALVTSSTFIIGMLSPVVNTPLLYTFGWQWVFTSGSIFSLFVLCYVTVCSFDIELQ
ncbi:transporter, major facilitator family protein [Plakobranchus ocellatus]|uniref:Transporter, major facilitator family protein n=1 Tax=Plakobranchus ocellatus TaxID=259542 RepID=A0AAV4BUM8_9GAST|nr:transporter, major facilitator family protein [Plakobranchus ocellatus]